ncbi:hypothetical protein C8Q73DRAFT_679297 [Cubamyces lactineus]|nr:hypothetical protein C8Q73DRAFT_679297 [Cubamyces lactineus]
MSSPWLAIPLQHPTPLLVAFLTVMDDFGLFDHCPDGHRYPLSLPVTHDGALPRQIVTPPTRVGADALYHSPHAPPFYQDLQNFDDYVDASLNGQGTIDPALLQYNPQTPGRIPSATSSIVARTESSLSTWTGTDATSPPTSPEYSGKDVEDSPSCALTEEELLELAELLTPDDGSGADFDRLFVSVNEAHPVGASADCERALPQHSGAVMVHPHAHDLGIQAAPQHVSVATDTSVVPSMGPAASSDLTRRKSPKPERPPRKQSTEKKHSCPIHGCETKMARPSNLKEHVAKVHNKERPFLCSVADCGKAADGAGYCRKEDRDNHIRKKHPDVPMPPKQPKKSRLLCSSLWYDTLYLAPIPVLFLSCYLLALLCYASAVLNTCAIWRL